MNIVRKILVLTVLVLANIGNMSAQCGIRDTIIKIPDDKHAHDYKIIVENAAINDLSDPAQGVCAVFLKFDHWQIRDITMDLVSPAGQSVRLIGPRVSQKVVGAKILWDIVFVRAQDAALKVFDNHDNWSVFSTYTGSYYPYRGNLEDFNKGTVNGIWSLIIHDHDYFFDGNLYDFQIEFCNTDSLECEQCAGDAGYFPVQEYYFCKQQDSIGIEGVQFHNIQPQADRYGYAYLISKDDSLIEISAGVPDINNYVEGRYTICGLSYYKPDSAKIFALLDSTGIVLFKDSLLNSAGLPFCAALTDTCIEVNISKPYVQNIDTVLCAGENLYFQGKYYDSTGVYYIPSRADLCDTAYLLNLDIIELDAGIIPSGQLLTCANTDTFSLLGTGFDPSGNMAFTWVPPLPASGHDTTRVHIGQPGDYYFVLKKDFCTDTAFIHIDADTDVPVLDIDVQQPDCEHDSARIEVRCINAVLDSIVWRDEAGNLYYGSPFFAKDTGFYYLSVRSTGGCKAYDVVYVKKDTVGPQADFTADTLTCNNPYPHIYIYDDDDVRDVFWIETGSTLREPVVTNSGWYHVILTGYNGCSRLDSVYVPRRSDPPEFTVNYENLNCANASTILDFESPQFITRRYWILPQGDTVHVFDLEVDSPGDYIIEVTNIYGCSARDTIQVALDTIPPVLQVASDTVVLHCNETAKLKASAQGHVNPLTWHGPGGFYDEGDSVYVELGGDYVVTATGQNYCMAFDTIHVVYDTLMPDIKIYTDTISCIDSIADITLKYTGNYFIEWRDPVGMRHTGNKINVPLGGYYYITVTDINNNCAAKYFAYVPVDTVKPAIDIVYEGELSCLSDSVVLKVEPPDGLVSYFWAGPGVSSTADSIIVYENGLYTVKVVSTGYCEGYDSILINKSGIPSLKKDTLYLNCKNGLQVTLGLEGIVDTFEFYWESTGFSSHDPHPVVTVPGLYRVTISDDNCVDSTSVLVLVDTLKPVISIDYDPVITCNPGYSVIKATIGGNTEIESYHWERYGQYFSSFLTDTVTQEGLYTFIVTATNGCMDSLTINIALSNEHTDIEARGDTLNCYTPVHDLYIEAFVDGAYDTLQWFDLNGNFISNDSRVHVDSGGTYLLRVVNDNSCVSYDTAFVIVDLDVPEVKVLPVDTITCYNDSVDIVLEINAVDPLISWLGPFGFTSSGDSIRVGVGGEYFLSVLDRSNGCEYLDTIEVYINKIKPLIELQAHDLTCDNAITDITVKTTAKNYDITWDGVPGYIVDGKKLRVKSVGMYYATVTDLDNGCSAYDSIYIKGDFEYPVVTAHDYHLPCDSTKVKMTVTADQAGCSYIWQLPDGSTRTGSTIYTDIPGTYYVSVISNRNGCTTTVEVNVYDDPVMPEFNAYGDFINCKKDSAVLKVEKVYDDKSWIWRGPGLVSTEKYVTVFQPGEYTVTVTGKNGCDSTAVVQVLMDTVKPEIAIDYVDTLYCDKHTGRLHVDIVKPDSVVYLYYWTSKEGRILSGAASATPVIEGQGMYFVRVENIINGCTAQDSAYVVARQYTPRNIVLEIKPPTCFGYSDGYFRVDTVEGGVAPFTFSLDDKWYTAERYFGSKTAGTYTLFVKDKNGCKADTLIVMPEGAEVQVKLGANPDEVYTGEPVEITALIRSTNEIASYHWRPEELFEYQDTSKQTVYPLKSTEIILKVTDINGCSDEDEIWIKVRSNPDIYIPNIFSPGGDNHNDYFYVKTGNGVKAITTLAIFDRWGELIFKKDNPVLNYPQDGWDGKFKGDFVPSGVYVYMIEVLLNNNEKLVFSGDVTIVK